MAFPLRAQLPITFSRAHRKMPRDRSPKRTSRPYPELLAVLELVKSYCNLKTLAHLYLTAKSLHGLFHHLAFNFWDDPSYGLYIITSFRIWRQVFTCWNYGKLLKRAGVWRNARMATVAIALSGELDNPVTDKKVVAYESSNTLFHREVMWYAIVLNGTKEFYDRYAPVAGQRSLKMLNRIPPLRGDYLAGPFAHNTHVCFEDFQHYCKCTVEFQLIYGITHIRRMISCGQITVCKWTEHGKQSLAKLIPRLRQWGIPQALELANQFCTLELE